MVTGGRVPAYLGSSGSTTSAILSITGFVYGNGNLNSNTSLAQGAIVILGLAYIGFSLLVFIFGHSWISFLMPPGKSIKKIILGYEINSFFFIVLGGSGSRFDCRWYWVTSHCILFSTGNGIDF